MTVRRNPWTIALGVAAGLVTFGAISLIRDTGYGGPHHDEVIALHASKALEREYDRCESGGRAPFHEIVPASRWHVFTHDFQPVAFSEIRDDVMTWDKHPPLAFWVFNRWLSLFRHAGYQEAVVLTWLEIAIASGLLALAVFQHTGSIPAALFGFLLFLSGNSAVFTSTWVRQYGLFIILFALAAICAAELSRPRLSVARLVLCCFGLGAASLLGMLTQYTFATMTLPMHLALLIALVHRKAWARMAGIGAAYLAAGALFFVVVPGAVGHARVVSDGFERHWQVQGALEGVPQMLIPVPSSLPARVDAALGVLVLAGALGLGILACRRSVAGEANRPDPRIVLSGMLGAGLAQFVLVAVGVFPGWATSPHHLCAFWWLTALAAAAWFVKQTSRIPPAIGAIAIAGMAGMQVLYAWHCHSILPRINTSYVASERPDLVCLDNLSRGFVLQLTDVMPNEQEVLVTDGSRMRQQIAAGSLRQFGKILYLPMEASVASEKAATLQAARDAGLVVRELPVVHPGLYEAVLLETPETIGMPPGKATASQ